MKKVFEVTLDVNSGCNEHCLRETLFGNNKYSSEEIVSIKPIRKPSVLPHIKDNIQRVALRAFTSVMIGFVIMSLFNLELRGPFISIIVVLMVWAMISIPITYWINCSPYLATYTVKSTHDRDKLDLSIGDTVCVETDDDRHTYWVYLYENHFLQLRSKYNESKDKIVQKFKSHQDQIDK